MSMSGWGVRLADAGFRLFLVLLGEGTEIVVVERSAAVETDGDNFGSLSSTLAGNQAKHDFAVAVFDTERRLLVKIRRNIDRPSAESVSVSCKIYAERYASSCSIECSDVGGVELNSSIDNIQCDLTAFTR